MSSRSIQHRRAHNILLISRLLNQRDASSPFTLILDNLEQSGQPLLAELRRRASIAKIKIVYISFETLQRPSNVDTFIEVHRDLTGWHRAASDAVSSKDAQRKLVMFDTLNPMCAVNPSELSELLSSFIGPLTSICAVYHTDMPVIAAAANPYSPSPLVLLRYLATTLFTMHSFHHVLARKAARDRSQAEPPFGLDLEIAGVVQSPGANGLQEVVLEMEHRRKSGRGVHEWYAMHLTPGSNQDSTLPGSKNRENISLLEDHPSFRPRADEHMASATNDEPGSTFELGLTEKQRRDRAGVVLPYFDAQKGEGDGGRILYDMGSEDDFDEEEDEI